MQPPTPTAPPCATACKAKPHWHPRELKRYRRLWPLQCCSNTVSAVHPQSLRDNASVIMRVSRRRHPLMQYDKILRSDSPIGCIHCLLLGLLAADPRSSRKGTRSSKYNPEDAGYRFWRLACTLRYLHARSSTILVNGHVDVASRLAYHTGSFTTNCVLLPILHAGQRRGRCWPESAPRATTSSSSTDAGKCDCRSGVFYFHFNSLTRREEKTQAHCKVRDLIGMNKEEKRTLPTSCRVCIVTN